MENVGGLKLRKNTMLFRVTKYDGSGNWVHDKIDLNHEFFKTVKPDSHTDLLTLQEKLWKEPKDLEWSEGSVMIDKDGNKFLVTRLWIIGK